MAQFEGKCVGGPLDGKMLAHWAKSKEYFRGLPVEQDYIKMGEYRLNDFGQWHWHETKEGKAADVLFGRVTNSEQK